LSEWAIEQLQKLKVMADGSRYVLPNADASAPADPKYITRSVARCLKRFKKHGVAAFTPHDLRRTGRTGLARLGVKADIAERVLNHARERIEATYDVHEYVDEKREALQTWAKYLAELRDGQPPAQGTGRSPQVSKRVGQA
jgi:integrase